MGVPWKSPHTRSESWSHRHPGGQDQRNGRPPGYHVLLFCRELRRRRRTTPATSDSSPARSTLMSISGGAPPSQTEGKWEPPREGANWGGGRPCDLDPAQSAPITMLNGDFEPDDGDTVPPYDEAQERRQRQALAGLIETRSAVVASASAHCPPQVQPRRWWRWIPRSGTRPRGAGGCLCAARNDSHCVALDRHQLLESRLLADWIEV